MRTYLRIYAIVRKIPRGKVATYGDVATRAGLPGHARMVGYALAALEDDSVPWHRVINAQGRISPRPNADEQQQLLAREGVALDERGRINLTRHRWGPMSSRRARQAT